MNIACTRCCLSLNFYAVPYSKLQLFVMAVDSMVASMHIFRMLAPDWWRNILRFVMKRHRYAPYKLVILI